MKKRTYIYMVLCLMMMTWGTVGCMDEELIRPDLKADLKDFSLQEAKEFFQTQIKENLVLSRSLDSKENQTLSPGDFVPEWETAVGSSADGLACYDVPISSTYRFKAISVDESNGTTSTGKVNVYQKLVIVKDIKNKKTSQYILTLIPSKACDNRNGAQTCSKFINCADKGGFTGVAIYSCVYSQITARVSIYKEGIKTQGVFLLSASSRAELKEKCELARMLVSSVTLQKSKAAVTRGEDDWTWGDFWLDEVVITPDPEPDYGQNDDWNSDYFDDYDKWLEENCPDSGIDPEPTDPEWGESGGGSGTESDNTEEKDPEAKLFNFSKTEEDKVMQLLKQLKELKGIDYTKYTIKKTDVCASVARTSKDGKLQICGQFFNLPRLEDRDRIAIIFHEMYHIDNNHFGNWVKLPLDHSITVNPPSNIENLIKEKIEEECTNFSPAISKETLDFEYQREITFTVYISTEYYSNELKTHEAERNEFPDVSDYYERERTILEWKYQEQLNIAINQQKK